MTGFVDKASKTWTSSQFGSVIQASAGYHLLT